MHSHHYFAYGIYIQSDRPISSLVKFDGADEQADVQLRHTAIEKHLKGRNFTTRYGNWQAGKNCFLLEVYGVARYLVMDGDTILIDAVEGASQADINAFLVSSSFAALLQQRHFLTLHASAVSTGDGAALFVGKSGIGKSTTLTALANRGYQMVTDDIAAIIAEKDAIPTVTPAFPIVRLREDVLDRLGKDRSEHQKLRENLCKYLVKLDNYAAGPQPLHKIFLIDIGNVPKIHLEKLSHTQAFYWLSRFTFRKRFYDGLGLEQFHFGALANLLNNVSVYMITRPDGTDSIDAVTDTIVTEIGAPMAGDYNAISAGP